MRPPGGEDVQPPRRPGRGLRRVLPLHGGPVRDGGAEGKPAPRLPHGSFVLLGFLFLALEARGPGTHLGPRCPRGPSAGGCVLSFACSSCRKHSVCTRGSRWENQGSLSTRKTSLRFTMAREQVWLSPQTAFAFPSRVWGVGAGGRLSGVGAEDPVGPRRSEAAAPPADPCPPRRNASPRGPVRDFLAGRLSRTRGSEARLSPCDHSEAVCAAPPWWLL